MTRVLFVGPSLPAGDLPAGGPFILRPPARQGDVFRAVRDLRPAAIGLIDGYFEGQASVWHKEILFALSEGVDVYGSASMGALRAAELASFGMVGVGVVFEAYRDGIIDADDEVALLHGPAEAGYVALTEPLVNVRSTLAAARASGILAARSEAAILAAARAIQYKQRSWHDILARLPAAPWVERFAAWLPDGYVDRKRLDARAMVERMEADRSRPEEPARRPPFAPTFLWERALARWTSQPSGLPEAAPDEEAAILDELRLDPPRYWRIKVRALASMLALGIEATPGTESRREETSTLMRRHRERHGLLAGADLSQWLQRQGLARRDYDRLIEEQAILDDALRGESVELRARMIALLRLDGGFARAAERARAKRAALVAATERVDAPPDIVERFLERQGKELADILDELGLPSRKDLHRLLAAEDLYCRLTGG